MVNGPQFQPNLQQPPPAPDVQTNQPTNYHMQQQQANTLLTPRQPFNTHLLQSFNPQVPPPYFPQYPPSNSPSVGSTDSSILVALQKQWEKQERLDRECNEMERQKEERKRMKEERGKGTKKGGKKISGKAQKSKIKNETELTRLLRKFLGLMAPTPVTVLTGWNRLKHLSMNTIEGFTEKNYYSTVEPVCARPSMHYHKKLPTSTSRMQYYGTIPTSELCHSN